MISLTTFSMILTCMIIMIKIVSNNITQEMIKYVNERKTRRSNKK